MLLLCGETPNRQARELVIPTNALFYFYFFVPFILGYFSITSSVCTTRFRVGAHAFAIRYSSL